MIPRRSFPNRAALGLALAALATLAGRAHPAAAADLAPYAVSPGYAALPPSPCLQLEQSFSEALRSIRLTARLFRSQDRAFHRLKRIRANDGFSGPDISLNTAMTAEQIDVATKVTEVSISVAHARQWSCFSAARLNRIDNEASRINQQIAQKAFWIDPRTFY
jgi:hypothetical protein